MMSGVFNKVETPAMLGSVERGMLWAEEIPRAKTLRQKWAGQVGRITRPVWLEPCRQRGKWYLSLDFTGPARPWHKVCIFPHTQWGLRTEEGRCAHHYVLKWGCGGGQRTDYGRGRSGKPHLGCCQRERVVTWTNYCGGQGEKLLLLEYIWKVEAAEQVGWRTDVDGKEKSDLIN